jgi:hypothetical protein
MRAPQANSSPPMMASASEAAPVFGRLVATVGGTLGVTVEEVVDDGRDVPVDDLPGTVDDGVGVTVVVVTPIVVLVVDDGAEVLVVDGSTVLVVTAVDVVVEVVGETHWFSQMAWPAVSQFFAVTSMVPSSDVGGMMSWVCPS